MTYYKANMCLTSNDIQHFGVPGMKWGVRKNRGGLANSLRSFKMRKQQGKDVQSEKQARRSNLKKALALAGGTAVVGAIAYLGYRNYKGNSTALNRGAMAVKNLKNDAKSNYDFAATKQNVIGAMQKNAANSNRLINRKEKKYISDMTKLYDDAMNRANNYNTLGDNLSNALPKMNTFKKLVTPQSYTNKIVDRAINMNKGG